MQASHMELSVQLPSQAFADKKNVLRITAETRDGSFGILPHRRDIVAALTPGILVYETKADGEAFIAVDVGVLVKTGMTVHVAVRRAIAGVDLVRLREAMTRAFLTLDHDEQDVRSVMAKLENGFIRRFAALRDA